MDPLKRSILLASQSPRRKELLERAGFNFRIESIDTDESFSSDMPVDEVAEFLARQKADASLKLLREGETLLAADSVVIVDDTIYGKPVDREDAIRIIRILSGRAHRVITGVCLANEEKQVSFSGVSHVHFNALTDEEIEFYVDTYKPFDKAGAYAIQEWIGLCKISRIEGTYANIMGLPVDLVYQNLLNF